MIQRLALVCGGRDYDDRITVKITLDRVAPVLVVHGDCRDRHGSPCGADKHAGEWAVLSKVRVVGVPATWGPSFDFDRSQGPKRNAWMLELAQLLAERDALSLGVVAFPGGRGTAGMRELAKKAGVPVWDPVPNREES